MQTLCHVGRPEGGLCSTESEGEGGDEVREVDGALLARVKNVDFILNDIGNHCRVLSWGMTGPNLHCKRIIFYRDKAGTQVRG